MARVFGRDGTKKLYTNLVGVDGVRRQVSTGLNRGQEAAAEKWVTEREREIACEVAKLGGATGALTVARWIEEWSGEQRDRDVVDWSRNKNWLLDLVAPDLGHLLVRDVRTPHVVALFKKLRRMPSEATGKPRASRTLHNIHGVVRTMLRDAVLAGHLEHAPESLDERQLGTKKDANPEWRADAQFTRDEVQAMISSPQIPWDRRVQYAIELLGGMRPGEVAALRVRHYDPARQPLGSLRIAKSYSGRAAREKGTKTGAVRVVPVHPTLAAILAEWLLSGWAQMMGRAPEADDLIVPLPPADARARTQKTGEAFRPDYYARRRWVEEDLPALGWRHRRHYDTRATFVTIAVDDGANGAVIRDRVTHTKPRRDGFDYYDRGDHWIETCREVAKLQIVRPREPESNLIALPLAVGSDAVLMQSENRRRENGLRRRASKADAVSLGSTRFQSEHEDRPDRVEDSGTDERTTASELMQVRSACDIGLMAMINGTGER
jgi:integrase